MPKWAYYNEIDPFAAGWLRELIKAGHIAPGEVDTRSIDDVVPDDLAGFVQCHFFAGIGVWSYALRRAGWPDDRPVWTGSCPCQPFSAAGKGEGFADERHLWPAFFHLISQCRPVTVFGEQVASKDGLAWLDLVQADLEGTDYTVRAVDTCAAGFGAPHIRQRLYWAAERWLENTLGQRSGGWSVGCDEGEAGEVTTEDQTERSEPLGGLADASSPRHHRTVEKPEEQTWNDARLCVSGSQCGTRWLADSATVGCLEAGGGISAPWSDGPTGDSAVGRVGNSLGEGLERLAWDVGGTPGWSVETGSVAASGGISELDDGGRPGPTNDFWRDADWIFCRDGKWRPAQPGTFPLASRITNRVGLLRGAGNAINAVQAEEFIRAYIQIGSVVGV